MEQACIEDVSPADNIIDMHLYKSMDPAMLSGKRGELQSADGKCTKDGAMATLGTLCR